MSEYLKPTYDGPPSPSSFRSRLLSISKCACRWILALSALFAVTARVTAADIALLEQEAFREAIAAVADSVVQVRTVGGLDRVGKTLIAKGPTTGLIVSPNGYIVSSAFNFAQQPLGIQSRAFVGILRSIPIFHVSGFPASASRGPGLLRHQFPKAGGFPFLSGRLWPPRSVGHQRGLPGLKKV